MPFAAGDCSGKGCTGRAEAELIKQRSPDSAQKDLRTYAFCGRKLFWKRVYWKGGSGTYKTAKPRQCTEGFTDVCLLRPEIVLEKGVLEGRKRNL